MKFSSKMQGSKLTLAPDGRIDTMTSPELDAEIKRLSPGVTELVLDFADVAYISSAGLRVLLSAQRAMRSAGGDMSLVNVKPAVQEVLDITGFSAIFTLS